MFRSVLSHMIFHSLADQLRRKKSVFSRQCEHLVTAMFYSSRLMHIDMPCRSAQYALIRTKNRRYHRRVCLSSSYQEMDIDIISAQGFPDSFTGSRAIMVFSITDRLFKIGFHQALHDTVMRAFVIVTLKLIHIFLKFRK